MLPDTGVPFLWPTALHLAETTDGPARQWVQIAKIGKFFSQRYGKFEITTTDLRTMLHNFKHITPMAPTQLPVDYDHLSMQPKQPGDGKAAGWFTGEMELRNGGDTLWGEIEFTPAAATHVKNGEYRFVSPSFIKNYVFKDGENIGTTLLAAAITNHPFLEGMAAITLSNDLGELAVQLAESGGHTMEVGQVVSIKPEVDPTHAGHPLEILEVAGAGADAFAKLKDATGAPLVGWFRIADLEPAKVVDPNAVAPAAPVAAPAAPVAKPNPFVKHLSEDHQMENEVLSLRDAKGQTAEVKAADVQQFLDEQIAAAKAINAVPSGSVVISASKLGEFEATAQVVTSLRQEVTTLREQNDAAEQAAHLATVTARLDTLSKAGKLSKPERDWALKTYADPIALAAFEEWHAVASAKPALVNLSAEYGSARTSEPPNGRPDGQLLILAQARAKEKGIALRDAIKEVGTEQISLSSQYLDSTSPIDAGPGRRGVH